MANPIRDKYGGEYCTLDGRPAVIIGNEWAIVVTIDDQPTLRFEWSWEAVENIMENNGGQFKS